MNKQLYIEGKIKHSRRSANTKSSREKCIKTIKSRSKRRIVADERCIQKHDSVSQEICDHLLNSYSDSKCLGLETHSENELCILESESGSDTNISQNRMTIRDNYSHRVLKKTVKIASDMALKSSALMHTCVDDGHHSSVKVRSDQPKFDVQTVDEIEGVLLNLEKGIESSIKKLHSKPILNDVPKVCNFVKICVSSSVDSNSKTKEVRCLTKEYDNVHSDADVSTNLILNQVNSKCTFQAAAQHEVIVNMSNTASIGKGILIQNVSPIKPNILRTPGKNDDACYKCVEDIADSFGRYGSSVCQEYALNEFSGKRQITSNQKQTESVEHFCVIESNCENDVHFKMENSTSKIRDIHVTRKCVSDVSVHLCQLCNKVKCLKSYWSLLNHKQDDYSQLANNIVRGPLSCKVEVINLQSKMVSELSYSETNANIENLISSKIKIPVAINISDTRHSTLENISSLSSSAGSFLPPQKKLLTATWNLAADRPKWDATVDLYLHCDDVIFPVHR